MATSAQKKSNIIPYVLLVCIAAVAISIVTIAAAIYTYNRESAHRGRDVKMVPAARQQVASPSQEHMCPVKDPKSGLWLRRPCGLL